MRNAVPSMAVLVFGVSLLSACGDSTNTAGATADNANQAAAKEVVKVTAGDLFAAYEENEVAADEQFKGKIVEVTGKVQSIDKDAFDNVVINMKTSNEFMPVHLKMDDSEKAQAITTKKGSKISIQCEGMTRTMGDPYGSKCHFVAVEPEKSTGKKKVKG